MNILFDSAVQDFLIGDLVVNGGTASGLKGKGYYYTATVTPSDLDSTSPIAVSVPANSVNTGGTGNRTAVYSVLSEDIIPPTRIFNQYPDRIFGAFEVNLNFSEPVTGVGPEDFRIQNGLVESVSGNGVNYILTILPYRFGDVEIVSLVGGVEDAMGNEPDVEAAIWVSGGEWSRLTAPANQPSISQGFGFEGYGVEAAAVVPEGSREGNREFNPDIFIQYEMRVPHAGAYVVRGLTLANDAHSASFFLGVDDEPAPSVWSVNRGPGEIDSGQWHWGTAGTADGPYVYQLAEGLHILTVYGRDDGTRLRTIELAPLRPFPMWGDVPALTNSSPFTVPLDFTDDVTGLAASDFLVTGGHVSLIVGQGRAYQVSIVPTERDVSIVLPTDTTIGPGGFGNSDSHVWRFIYRHPYNQWALDAGLDDSAAGALSDIDHDGVEQILEFAFGLNPWVPDHGASGLDFGLPEMTVSTENANARLILKYARRKNIPGLIYQPQFSDSPSGWVNSDATPLIETINDSWENVTVTDQAATGQEPKRFGRVKVTLPDN